MKLTKYIHIIGIIFTGLLIVYFYTQSIVDNKTIYEIEKNLSILKEKESLVNYNYSSIRDREIKHFDTIRAHFNDLKVNSYELKQLVRNTDNIKLKINVEKYLVKLKEKEKTLEKLLSNTAVYNNLISYFLKITLDNSRIFYLIDDKVSLEILNIQILYENKNFKRINRLLEKLKDKSGDFLSENEQILNHYIQFTKVLVEKDKQLTNLVSLYFDIDIYKDINLIANTLNKYFLDLEEKSKYFNILLIGIVISLFIWIFYFINILNKANRKIDQTINELNFQKSALDEHAIVSIADTSGNITYINEKFIEISQYSKEELLGQNHRLLKSKEHDEEFFIDMWSTISKGRVWSGQIKNRRKDGSHYWVESTIVPFLDEYGVPFQYISIRTDITSQKRIQKELVLAKEESDRLNKVKSEFLANMSHELRTPLNGVLGLTKVAIDNEPSQRQKNYLEKIYSSGNILLKIINDLLDYSKIEAGKLSVEKSEFSIDSLLESISHLLAVKVNEKSLNLYFNRDMAIPDILVGDLLRISQILMNIIGNSIKFTQSGDIKLFINLIESSDDKIKLEFIVKDTGIGMTKETLNNVFESFSQADVSTTRKYGGTGLGLTISKNLIDLMEGSINVSSELGVGTIFSFEIPFEYKCIKSEEKSIDSNIYLYQLDKFNLESIEKILIHKNITFIKCEELPNNLSNHDIVITENLNEVKHLQDISIIYLTNDGYLNIDDNNIEYLHKPIIPTLLLDVIRDATLNNMQEKKKKIKQAEIFKGLKVLLVEDNEINQLVATTVLEEFGCYVEIANDGEEAINILQEMKEYFDIIFMDIQMPQMNGYECTDVIRNKLELDLPIIAMTANSMKEDISKSLNVGMNSHISKPINTEEIKSIIKKYCY